MNRPSVRPRRSALYVPASNERALAKAPTLAADVLIYDLEDAVAPDAKDAARARVAAALADADPRHERVLRINGLATPWGASDVAAAATAAPDAVVLPKVESAEDVRALIGALDRAGAPDSLPVWCMIETPRGVLGAEAIAGAHPRVAALVAGTSDLAKDLRAAHTAERLPLLTGLGLCLLAARAHRLVALDGVHLDLADEVGFLRACRQGRELGFDGKTLIHPRTIAAANRTFAPTAEEVDWARRIIEAHEKARRAGQGVVVVAGRLIEQLHVEEAHRTLALHEAIGSQPSANS
jgi:citrate lyase subunit beta/citryl-CoA lyase